MANMKSNFALLPRRRSDMRMIFIMVSFLMSLPWAYSRATQEVDLDEIILKMQDDVLELAYELQQLYYDRCNTDVLDRCTRGNYHACLSELPTQQCMSEQEIGTVVEACGDGVTCASLLDLQTSTFRLPTSLMKDENQILVSRESVIESVCYSQGLDDYWIRKRQEDKAFWTNLGIPPPQAYFGSHTGAFRIFPGRPYPTCGDYDPRMRPWFNAASSGPKNVILVLDTSGSMEDLRLECMQEAAKRVLDTLTFSDRVAIVSFDTRAEVYAREGKYVYQATEENKKILRDAIDNFEAIGATNFLDAFEKAFEFLDNSIRQELIVSCGGGISGQTAILFLTDGVVTDPPEWDTEKRQDEVERFVVERLAALEVSTGRPPFLFTYSISDNPDVHEFPKRLACATTHGVWSKIIEPEGIMDALGGYCEVFAVGLGQSSNVDFTAWTEPYTFANGGGFGTTVAAPIYDRTTSPALFLGVVGIDLPISALDRAMGVSPDDPGATEARDKSLQRIARASVSYCPDVDLELCELESIRRRGAAGSDALCTSNCTEIDFVDIEPRTCAAVDDYPSDLLANRINDGRSYEERACCKVGIDTPSDECPAGRTTVTEGDDVGFPPVSEGDDDGFPVEVLIGVAVVDLVVIGALAVFCVVRRRRTAANDSNKPQDPPANGLVLTPARDPSTANNSSEPSDHGVNALVTPPTAPTTRPSSPGSEQGTNVASVTSSLPENLEYKDLGRDLESILKNKDVGQ